MIRTPGVGTWRPGLAIAGLAIFVVCSLGFENFASSDNVRAIALQSSLVLIAAMGAMTVLISGNIDVSIGSMFALVGVVVALVDVHTGSGLLAGLAGLAVGALLGAVNGLLVEFLGVSSLIITLATLAIYRGLAFVLCGGHSVIGLSDGFVEFGQTHLAGIPMPVIMALATFVLCAWMVSASVTGLRLFAVGGERQTAALLGVPARRLVVQAFVVNGMLVGLAAVLATSMLASGSPTVGIGLEFNVLTAVILGGVAFTGGKGHPLGVLLGVVTIGVLDAGLIFAGLGDWYQEVARGAMLLVALTADQVVIRRRRERAVALPRAPAADRPPDVPPGPGKSECDVAVRGLSVRFPGVEALQDVNVGLRGGEVVCLVGDNGAGKSTLVQVLSGAITPTTGQVLLAGQPLPPDSHSSRRAGVETVFQQQALCPNLSGIDNLVLGLEPRRRLFGILPMRDLAQARAVAAVRLGAFGIAVRNLERPVSKLSGGERQVLTIARVVRPDARVVVLDEPTAGLGVHQGSQVLDLVRSIARTQRTVVYVTHDVEEVFEIADRVVVLQRGRVAHDGPLRSLSRLELLALMSGRHRKEAARTLKAVDEERLRIERDLHDGAQQELLSAAMMVGVAVDSLGDRADPRLGELLQSSKQTIRQALGTLRNLSQGVYPVTLSEGGLSAAWENLAHRSPLPILIDTDVPRLPENIEHAAYFVVAEAITNAQKHAECSTVTVHARHDGQILRIEVSDDGRGGADEALGTGLAGMRARLQAFDGRLVVVSTPGAGTRLEISLPVR